MKNIKILMNYVQYIEKTKDSYVKCRICFSKELKSDEQSILCKKCRSRFNLTAKTIDYSYEGGQDIPSKEKLKLRTENAKQRINLIKKIIKTNEYSLIDIGCGSGEFLIEGSKHFKYQIGFDVNKSLINFCKNNNLNVLYGEFKRERINQSRENKFFISISHVLEHIEFPHKFLKKVVNNMSEGDVLWIEVPLWTGISFAEQKYKWKLWYEEHYFLFSSDIFAVIQNKYHLLKLAEGKRVFDNSNSISKLTLLKYILKYPIKSFKIFFTRRKDFRYLDFLLEDYGYAIFMK